ncbi:MAG: alcohol dehydrogenase catalytic domain-containing protein [Candidatus Bathyarchaeia archaeon]
MISKAFVYYAPYDVRLEKKEIKCGSNDILIKIKACGRCGTDQVIFKKGHPKVNPHAPIILGHEIIGEIVEVGSNVKNLRKGIGYKDGELLTDEYLAFKKGEKVTVQSRIARYRNHLMLIQDPITILSFYIDGGYSQYMRIPEPLICSGSVLRIPEDFSEEAAILVEPTACALESIFSTPHPVGVDQDGRQIFRSGILPGGYTGIIGSGTVSFIYARLAKLEGAKKVFVFVRSSEKEKIVKQVDKEFIAVNTFGKTHSEIVEDVSKLTSGHLLDDVIAACSDPDAQKLMLELYSPEGYAVGACFGGTHERVSEANMDNHHYRMAKTIGTSGCSSRSMETIIKWLDLGKLVLDGLCSKRIWTLDDSPTEFFYS